MCATGYSVCQYGQIANGSGRHKTAVNNAQEEVRSQIYAYVAQIFLTFGLAIPKISICLSYLRIFYTDVQGRRMIQLLIAILLLSIIPFTFETIFQCKPIHVYWTELRPASKCDPTLIALYINGSLNAIADIGLMAVVLPRILELQLHKRQRWALTGIVMLGWLAVGAATVRMVRVGTSIAQPDFEPSWDSYDVSIWSSTEIYLSLICASAPGIKPVLVKLVPGLLGSSLRNRTKATGPSIELSSRWKRTTIGSARMKKPNRETMWATADGVYTEFGKGRDENSLEAGSWKARSGDLEARKGSLDGGIFNKSEDHGAAV